MCKTSPLEILLDNNIRVIDKFLSPKECNEILFRMDFKKWHRSEVLHQDKENVVNVKISDYRKSFSQGELDFSESFLAFMNKVEYRLTNSFSFIKPRCFESWQATKYNQGDRFEPHLDCLPKHDSFKGLRDKTLLIYLQPPGDGGETYFRALNLWLEPIQGRLVVWDNLLPNGNCNYAMIHSGQPVKKGIKVILQTWQHKHTIEKSWRRHYEQS